MKVPAEPSVPSSPQRDREDPLELPAAGPPSEERTVEDVILLRRAIRRFAERPVPDELIVKLFSLAQRAPSEWNFQPWRWLVLRQESDRLRLAPLTYGRMEIRAAPIVVVALANTREWERAPEHLRQQVGAGRLTEEEFEAQLQRTWTHFRGHPERAREFAVANTMLAVMTLTLIAQAEGLGAGFIGTFDEEGIRREFQIPEDWAVATIVTLGFPADDPPRSARKALDDVIHWDRIGGHHPGS
jgi:nitroreductase